MSEPEFDEYLRQLSDHLGRRVRREEITSELRDHLDDQYEALVAAGASRDDAIARVLSELGAAPQLANGLTAVGRRSLRRRLVRWSGTSTIAVALSLVLLWAMWPQEARVPMARSSIAQAQPEAGPDAAPAPKDDTADAHEQKVEQALARDVDVDFQDVPLCDAIEYLSDVSGITMEIDTRALEEGGQAADRPVSLTLGGATLESVLNRMLRQLQLEWTYRDESIEITSQDRAHFNLLTRVYDVHDLVGNASSTESELDSSLNLASQLTSVVEACYGGDGMWASGGGNGVATVRDGALIVTQNWRLQRDIAGMLVQIRRAAEIQGRNAEGGARAPAAPTSLPPPSKRVERIRKALNSSAVVELVDAPLRDACAELAQRFDVDVLLDQLALDGDGIASEMPVTLMSRGATLRSILNRMTRRSQLAWTISDGSITITTPSAADTYLSTRFYPIGDLAAGADDPGNLSASVSSVLELIEQNLGQVQSPWSINGGTATALPLTATATLAISQTEAVHQQIERLLSDLRASRRKGQPLAKAGDPKAHVLQVYYIQDVSGMPFDMNSLVAMIKQLVEPASWDVAPDTYVSHFGQRLVVRHSPAVQRKLQRFLSRELRLNISSPGMPEGGVGGMGGMTGGGGVGGGGGGGFF